MTHRGLITALLLLAGAAVAGTLDATATPGAGRRWDVRILQPGAQQNGSFSEPGLAAGPRGRLLANACTANAGGPSTFWRSTDNGRSWTHGFGVGASPIGCGDADTAIGSDGYEYALTLGAGVDVYRSPDGSTWSGPASFPPPHGEDQPDRPWLVTVPSHPNEVHLFNSELAGNVVEWTSVDHGASFIGPIPVTSGSNSQAALTLAARPLSNPTRPDQLLLFYETASPAALQPSAGSSGLRQFPLGQLWQARSDDRGRSWTSSLVLDVTTAFSAATGTLGHLLPAVTIDGAGDVYVVLSVQLGSSSATHLFLVHSLAGGRWSTPVAVEHATPSNVMPAVTVGRPGELYVSWYASAAASFEDSTARWSEMVARTSDGLTQHPTFHVEQLSGAQPVHVGGVDVAGAVGSDLGQNWALRDFQSATTDSCRQPHITWAADYPAAGRTHTASLGRCPNTDAAGKAAQPAGTRSTAGPVSGRGSRLPATGSTPLLALTGMLATVAALVLRRWSPHQPVTARTGPKQSRRNNP